MRWTFLLRDKERVRGQKQFHDTITARICQVANWPPIMTLTGRELRPCWPGIMAICRRRLNPPDASLTTAEGRKIPIIVVTIAMTAIMRSDMNANGTLRSISPHDHSVLDSTDLSAASAERRAKLCALYFKLNQKTAFQSGSRFFLSYCSCAVLPLAMASRSALSSRYNSKDVKFTLVSVLTAFKATLSFLRRIWSSRILKKPPLMSAK